MYVFFLLFPKDPTLQSRKLAILGGQVLSKVVAACPLIYALNSTIYVMTLNSSQIILDLYFNFYDRFFELNDRMHAKGL